MLYKVVTAFTSMGAILKRKNLVRSCEAVFTMVLFITAIQGGSNFCV